METKKSIVSAVLAVSTVLFFGVAGVNAQSSADAKIYCDKNAKEKVKHWNYNIKYKCGFENKGGWSPSYSAHYNACMGAMNWALSANNDDIRHHRMTTIYLKYNNVLIQESIDLANCKTMKDLF